MRRIIIQGLLACLLALFPALVLAQTLTGYEYWFDDDVAGRQTGDLSGKEDIFISTIDTENLPDGVHFFNFRAKQSDGQYSAVTSSCFYKMKKEEESILEYWIDDDRSNVRTIQGSLASDGHDYIFNAYLDMRAVSPGLHRLNLRPRSTSGLTSGAITTADFIKISNVTANKLEYWIDGDRSTVHVIDGSLASDGSDYIFVNDLDLGDVTPGYHRLYYRAVSSTDLTASAVSMSPIIVKSRYYHDENEAVTVEKYGITVDNGEMELYEVPNPREIITQHHILDACHLSPGNHTVKATFWNSAGMSASVEQGFNVTVPEEPSITLTAQQEGGLVKLHFNSVANDKGYRLYRTLGNGTPIIADHKNSSVYPSNVNYVDNPAAGTYKYQAWIPYTDRNGNSKVLKSNEVSVTITKAQTEEEAAAQYGYVTGRIVCDKNMPSSGLMVRFSNDDETVPVQGTLFTRNKILKDTEVTLSVEGDETHEYEPVTLTVKDGANDVTLNGTFIEGSQPNNLSSDLIMASDLEMNCDARAVHLTFSVKNRSLEHWWYGKVRVRAIEKKKADNMHLDLNEMEYGSNNMFTGISEDISLGYGKTGEVTISLNGLRTAKDIDFYLYFESIGLWGGEGYTEELKPITGNSHYNLNVNPLVWTIPHGEATQEQWNQQAREEYAYLILGLSSVTPGFDGQVGDLDPIRTKVMAITGKRNAKEAAKALLDWIGDKSALEAINDPNLSNVTSAVKDILIELHDAVNPPLVERYWSNLVGSMSEALPAEQMIDVFSDILTVVNSDDQFEQTMTCSSLLLQAFAVGGDPLPLVSVMHTYSVVGKAMVDAINRFAQIVSGRYIVHRLKHNRVFGGGTEGRINTAVDFKIIVKEAHWYGDKKIDFTKNEAQKQIESACVKVAKLKARHSDGRVELYPPATFSFTLEYLKDGVMLKTDGNGVTDGSIEDFCEIAAFYIEIHWRNGRVSYIPLIQSTDGVGISLKDTQNENDDFSNTVPFVYTVTLTTETGMENMADELYLGKNKKRE